MMRPEADKPEVVDCAAVEAEGLSAEALIISLSLRPGVQFKHYCRYRIDVNVATLRYHQDH